MKRFLSVCLSVALLVIFFTISISAETYSVIYVNALGNSENDGQTAQTPVQTLSQAYEKVSNNGVIVIMGDITQSSMIFPEKSVVLTGQYQSNLNKLQYRDNFPCKARKCHWHNYWKYHSSVEWR